MRGLHYDYEALSLEDLAPDLGPSLRLVPANRRSPLPAVVVSNLGITLKLPAKADTSSRETLRRKAVAINPIRCGLAQVTAGREALAKAVSVYAGDRSFSGGDFGEKSFLLIVGGGITWIPLSHLPTYLSKSASWLAGEPVLGETCRKGANQTIDVAKSTNLSRL
uniref:Uncharacterized protein n=1 Tax=Bionectria ochroleuca TaxID=29856 RepID=A0A0B7K8C5_BIOOC